MQKISIPEYSKPVQHELIEYLLKNKVDNFLCFRTWQNAQLHLEAEFSTSNENFNFHKLKTFFINCLIYKIYNKTYSLSQEQIYYFCYPFLKNIHDVVFKFDTTPEFPTLNDKTVKQHSLFIKYAVDKNFDQDVWNEFEKLNHFNLRNEININVNNTQYGLDNTRKNLLLSHIKKIKRRKRKKITHNESLDNQLPVWLSKNKKNIGIPSSLGTQIPSSIGNSNRNQELMDTIFTESQLLQIDKVVANQFAKSAGTLGAQRKSTESSSQTCVNPVVIEEPKNLKIAEKSSNLNTYSTSVLTSHNKSDNQVCETIILDNSSTDESENNSTDTRASGTNKICDSDASFELPDFIYECWNWQEDSDISLVDE